MPSLVSGHGISHLMTHGAAHQIGRQQQRQNSKLAEPIRHLWGEKLTKLVTNVNVSLLAQPRQAMNRKGKLVRTQMVPTKCQDFLRPYLKSGTLIFMIYWRDKTFCKANPLPGCPRRTESPQLWCSRHLPPKRHECILTNDCVLPGLQAVLLLHMCFQSRGSGIR